MVSKIMSRLNVLDLDQGWTARRGERTTTVVLVAMLGVFLLYGAGFAQPEALHNAAHDARHAFAFACH
jgi:cobalt transporter subunit CbtB